MIRIAIATFLTLFLLSVTTPLQAQADTAPPYLYYYSRLLGGLIIERADGTDSRHIAADVIPPDWTGLGGPGWSPSGRYFAAYLVQSETFTGRQGRPYVIDLGGALVTENDWLGLMPSTSFMQWSPSGEDILLIVGSNNIYGFIPFDRFIWLINANTGELLAEFGLSLGTLAYEMSEIIWDVPNEQISFYVAPDTYDDGNYYRVTMYFDGTTIREPVSSEAFVSMYDARGEVEITDERYNDSEVSPSGIYEIVGAHPATLTNIRTGHQTELPRHTLGTMCHKYLWSDDEQYVITLNGAGMTDCGTAVLGVTDSKGELWRELGECSWAYPPCVGWLPTSVEIGALPAGSPYPTQLEPSHIEYFDPTSLPDFVYGMGTPTTHLFCREQFMAEIVDDNTDEVLFELANVDCPYDLSESIADEGLQIVIAHNPNHNLLATYSGFFDTGVSIWVEDEAGFREILQLNTRGYELEFTDDGEYLRARNFKGWKVYSVADILEYAARGDA